MMEELIGKQLGQYRVEATLGRGAMAAVFKAYQPSLDRYVAIKVLPPSFATKIPLLSRAFSGKQKQLPGYTIPTFCRFTILG